jgi:hypothetical protein
MGWMMGVGGLVALLAVVLVIVGVVLLVRFLAGGERDGMSFGQTALIVLAAVGVLALAGAGGMALMHGGMMSCCR